MEFPLAFPCCLPPDPLGVEYGQEYFLKVEAGRGSTFTTDYLFSSVKNGGEVNCLGMGEKSMALLLEISPFVLAYRCQYPMLLAYARGRIDEYVSGIIKERPTITRRDLISVDVLVTARSEVLRQPGMALSPPEYFVLSHKIKGDLGNKRVKKRLELERRESKIAGYKHFVFSRNGALDECGKTAKQIILWGKGLDFNSSFAIAHAMGDLFYKKYRDEPLDIFLIKICRLLRLTIDEGYQYFSAAIHLGCLFVDLSFSVSAQYPLHLISPTDAVPPWISFSGKGNSSLER